MGAHDIDEGFGELSRAGSRLRYWLHADPDPPLVARSLRTWAGEDPNACHAVIPDAGHAVNLDNPEAFNRTLVDFLDAQVPAG